MTDRLAASVRGMTSLSATALVPEIALHLATDATGIFEAALDIERPAPLLPPYWAFAWPAGQATARYILDNPDVVRGRRVLDIGAGSGVAAIAAAKAGAARVWAADIDALAAVAVQLNAIANGVVVETTTADVLGEPLEADLLLIGDLCYEPETATRVAGLLDSAAREGRTVLLADRSSARRPPVAFDLIATYDARLTPMLPAHTSERARLWQLQTKRRRPAIP